MIIPRRPAEQNEIKITQKPTGENSRRWAFLSKGKDYEQDYDREYMFWYNRITKLKKAGAPPEQIGRAQAALKEFRKKALIRKQQVKEKKLPASQFISWMIGREAVIRKICKNEDSLLEHNSNIQ